MASLKLFFKLSSILKEEHSLLPAMIIWSLWKTRNTKLWDNQSTLMSVIISWARDTLREWSSTQLHRHTAHTESISDTCA
ncbi:hypothetical protein TSUD_260780 [Trifolium subterraneum]|uniref:Reverse transcriptase zinc-binding domain-containing protein n=1 Tax=Trifolium subterraneum TaxID=3900 RepID=A0A2Z6LW12_TRISU|nr:hypothetical protein TSUD_260780 [Trifolium subterraneum]